jgi:hypothetical protein
MAQTKGFTFQPESTPVGNLAAPAPLQFVEGQALSPKFEVPTDIGLSQLSAGMLQATENLLSGIQVGVEGITTGLLERTKLDEQAEQKQLDRENDLEVAKERSLTDYALRDWYDEREFKRENPYADRKARAEVVAAENELRWTNPDIDLELPPLSGEDSPPLSGEDSPPLSGEMDPPIQIPEGASFGFGFKEKPGKTVEEFAFDNEQGNQAWTSGQSLEGVGLTADSTSTTQQNRPSGRFQRAPVDGGGTIVIDRATGKIIPGSFQEKDSAEGTTSSPTLTPEALNNLVLEGVSLDSDGKTTARFTPKSENSAYTEDQQKAIQRLSDRSSSDPDVKAAYEARRSLTVVKEALNKQTGFGDIAAINAFQRMIDPGVAVREGDVALIQSAISQFEQMKPKFLLAKLQSGDKLDPTTRQRMYDLASTIYTEYARNANAARIPYFRGLASKSGVDPDDVIEPFALPERQQLQTEIDAIDAKLSSLDPNSPEYAELYKKLEELVTRQESSP